MPGNEKQTNGEFLYQWKAYQNSYLIKRYWDYKDNLILKSIEEKHNTIIDVGYGEGIVLNRLIQKFPYKNIYGIDFMQQNVDICNQRGLPARQGDV